jgi:opacity protein-like surface antigen
MKLFLFVVITGGLLSVGNLSAQDDYDDEYYDDEYEYEDDYYYEDEGPAPLPDGPMKYLHLDVGYGPANISYGLGFRYWQFGATIGLTGVATDIPNYSRQTAPSAEETEKFPTIVVCFDLHYYYEINPEITAFATIGYYSQSDTILAKSDGYWYRYDAESTSGLTFGIGGQYALNRQIMVGLAYQNKRGIYAQIGYRWW